MAKKAPSAPSSKGAAASMGGVGRGATAVVGFAAIAILVALSGGAVPWLPQASKVAAAAGEDTPAARTDSAEFRASPRDSESAGSQAQPSLTTAVVDAATACDDKDKGCRVWADEGECTNNPGYMIRNCPSSCRTCDQLFEPTCDADGPNALKEGDIEATFTHAASLSQYAPTVLSRDPWVLIYDYFLSPEEAAEVIRVGGHDFQRSLAGDGVTPVRTSSTSWCNVPRCENEKIIKTVKQRALDIMRIPEGNSEHLQTLKYEPGQFYRMHHDQNADPKLAWEPRVYTFFLYLSDVEVSAFTTSFISNLWLHMREFQKPLAAGCENRAHRPKAQRVLS
ncbi:hypothetical protein T492DRAFT_934806 [Pavlovales sp. CCMP2436]|nr:hypothetical protein T492DRAFT_934806 [Pavlovales sp. CCMP2436]